MEKSRGSVWQEQDRRQGTRQKVNALAWARDDVDLAQGRDSREVEEAGDKSIIVEVGSGGIRLKLDMCEIQDCCF